MKLLVTTQAVDRNDPVLGFFCTWLGEFAKHCDVLVVCLRQGEHSLPTNVRVRVLPRGKIARAIALLTIAATEQYDGVFVHMNPEYLVVAGWLWCLRKVKSALWYTHKSVDLKLRIAALFANKVFTASKESFRLRSSKVEVMGHGIDTTFFSPDPNVPRGKHWLSGGRLMPSKRHDLAIRAAAALGTELRIAGEGPELAALKKLAHELKAEVHFLGGISQTRLRDEYRSAAKLLHMSETGSLDKVVLEALACGLPVDSSDPALVALPLNPPDPAYVREHHSLPRLILRIIAWYAR